MISDASATIVSLQHRHVATAGKIRLLPIDNSDHFHDTRNMEITVASERLAALGHETRLAIFRLLVEAGPAGVNAGLIGEKLEIPPPTLSFHLNHLSRVGLIRARQEGRFIFYVADYGTMDGLLAYLTANCCQGAQCLPKIASRAMPKKRQRNPSSR
jgi:DNA-binding transcriptional ArsR family regulator